ncbi:MAG: nuclear transport factor 2 family protein [Sphingobium sp.]|nr:nuclear transport factor 2 family protein [Sphingobium sp.]
MSADLAAEVAALRHELDLMKDAAAIRTLQHSYGYLMEKGLYQEIVDLFAPDAEMTFFGGVYRGRESIERVYLGRIRKNFTKGRNGPVRGLLCDVLQMQDVVTVADDRQTAKGRFRALLMGGTHAGVPDAPKLPYQQWWEAGVYENDYVRENGVWKYKRLGYQLTWMAEFDKGWANAPDMSGYGPGKTFPEDPLGPDEILDNPYRPWPETWLLPFHYPHPVTGEEIVPEGE